MFQNLFDSHSHSENSLDGAHSVTFMMENAIERGLQGLAITDHCDCEQMEELEQAARMQQSVIHVAMARVAFRNQAILTCGIELGQPLENPQGARRILREQPFDFVLLSQHHIPGWEEFYFLDYSKLSADELHQMMTAYFEQLLETIKQWQDFDALAHMTLPVRYAKVFHRITIDLHRYREPMEAVLRELVQRGKALELNTSGLRNELGETLPPAWLARRFRELGGEYVTIGSDAHNAMDVGQSVQQGMQILLDAGFSHFTFYRQRKPYLLRIV